MSVREGGREGYNFTLHLWTFSWWYFLKIFLIIFLVNNVRFEGSSSDLVLQVLSSFIHSNSAWIVSFIRDLGTTLSHLHVLWMAHCGLSDLDGISSCSSLKVSIDVSCQMTILKLSSVDTLLFTCSLCSLLTLFLKDFGWIPWIACVSLKDATVFFFLNEV